MASSSTSISRRSAEALLGALALLALLTVAGCGEQATTDPVDPDNTPPAAVLQAPASARPGESVAFDASGSFDEDGRVVTYLFHFGDDSPWFESVSPAAFHTWAAEGVFEVTLVVLDDDGTKDSTTVEVEVR